MARPFHTLQPPWWVICCEPEWPSQLDDLGPSRPVVLWLRGGADLRYACLRSISVVGSRAATAYGSHVGTELAAAVAEHGWSVVSGGPNRTNSKDCHFAGP
jgi:DNA processing protein